MRRKRYRVLALLIGLLLIAAILPTAAFAEGLIETDRPVTLTISYKDSGKSVPNAAFSLYKVADVDAYVRQSLTPEFQRYRNVVSGLSDMDDLTQAQWSALASTLKGYVQRDGLRPAREGRTDSEGLLSFDDLEVGLYLVTGRPVTTDDFCTYSASPFLIFLPDRDSANNVWDYDLTVSPKYTKEEDDDKYVTRKVLKIWDDEGYESVRPKEVTVQLLKDGKVYDTETLNENNNWRYAWDELPADHDWEVVEKELEGYSVTVTRDGITFTATNKFVAPITGTNLPIQKRITGDKPKEDAKFTFVFTAKDPANPMPEGSSGTVKEIEIVGAGSKEIGEIEFEKPGTYVYTVKEKNGGVKGYTYDTTVYTLTYKVTEKDGELICRISIVDEKGNEAETVEFTNPYYPPKIPQTGVLWWPVPILLCAGFVFVMIGVTTRRRNNG